MLDHVFYVESTKNEALKCTGGGKHPFRVEDPSENLPQLSLTFNVNKNDLVFKLKNKLLLG